MLASLLHIQFFAIALAVILIAERTWALAAKIIRFLDRRAAAKKGPRGRGPKQPPQAPFGFPRPVRARVPSKTRFKLPIAAGGPLPNKSVSQARSRGFVKSSDGAHGSKRKAA